MAISNAEFATKQQLMLIANELLANTPRGYFNYRLVTETAALCALLGYNDLAKQFAEIALQMPDFDPFENAITNIDVHEIDVDKFRRVCTVEEVEQSSPLYSDADLMGDLHRLAETEIHLKLSLEGDIDGAARAASGELALEEIAATLAVQGQFERALEFIDSQPVSDFRRSSLRFLVLIEKCRKQTPGFASELQQTPLAVEGRRIIVLALAGRRPWGGYPFPEW